MSTSTVAPARHALLASSLALGLGLAASAAAQPPAPPSELTDDAPATAVEEVVVTGDYQARRSNSPRLTQPLLETPQTITILPDEMLAEQGRRTLRDSLRNVTGISIQAGEGNPPGGGDALKIRGFSARDDILVDGMPDVGVYFRDPFNAESIEVLKGPSSAFAGRGNTGGTINIISRLPLLEEFREAEVGVGTDNLFRATFDVNHVVSEEQGAAVRLNGLYHAADEPGRDFVQNERWGVAASAAFGLETATETRLSWFHIQQNDLPDYGVPNARLQSFIGSGFEGGPVPVDLSNFYGYSSDYRDITADILTLRVDHLFSDQMKLRSAFRYGRTHNDSVVSAPRYVGAPTTIDGSVTIVGNRKPRDQVDEIWITQNDLSVLFETGEWRHEFVGGLELSRETAENRRRLDRDGPPLNLLQPTLIDGGPLTYNGTRARLTTDVAAVYVFDNIDIGQRWEFNVGARLDRVDTRVQGFDDSGLQPAYVTDLDRTDVEASWNFALLYKPVEGSSVYLAYGTSFEPSGRAEVVQLAGGNNNPPTTPASFDIDPERSESVELGARWQTPGARLTLSGAVFQIVKTNARTPGANPGDPLIVLGGEQQVRGFEVSAQGALTDSWDVFAGYTYLNGEFTRTNVAADQGRRLDYVPEHSLSVWTSYEVTKSFKIGGGVQHVSDRVSEIPPNTTFLPVTVDAYTVVDAFAEYQIDDRLLLRLNGYNLTDEQYFQGFQSAQSTPSARRAFVVSLGIAF